MAQQQQQQQQQQPRVPPCDLSQAIVDEVRLEASSIVHFPQFAALCTVVAMSCEHLERVAMVWRVLTWAHAGDGNHQASSPHHPAATNPAAAAAATASAGPNAFDEDTVSGIMASIDSLDIPGLPTIEQILAFNAAQAERVAGAVGMSNKAPVRLVTMDEYLANHLMSFGMTVPDFEDRDTTQKD
jgi:hypothetical protein